MASLVIQPGTTLGKDAGVDEANADTAFGAGTSFAIGYRTATSADLYTYIQFNTALIPPGSVVSAATLGIYAESTNENEEDTVDNKIYRVTESWVENTVTWNTKPANDSTVHSTLAIEPNTTGYKTFESLGTLVQGWVDGDYANYGLLIKHPTDGVKPSLNYTSSEGTSAQRPKLTVTYKPAGGSFLLNMI